MQTVTDFLYLLGSVCLFAGSLLHFVSNYWK